MCFKVLRDSCDDRIDGTLAVGRLSLVSSFAASPRSLVTPAFVSAMPLVSHSRRTTALVLLATALCGACDDGTITIKGDVPGLDTIGLRGDSLIARAGRPPMFMDSLKAVADGKLSRSPRDANDNAGTDATAQANARAAARGAEAGNSVRDNPMNIRAQARGDSMARAAAARFSGGTGTTSAHRDTARGVVTVLGTPPATQVVLKTTTGAQISVSGMITTGLSRLAGKEIVVRGLQIAPRDVVVNDYIVRGSDGMSAWDGVLEGSDNAGWSLRLTDGSGRQRLTAVPAPLRTLAGTRVWVAVPAGSTTPRTYGAITRR